MWKYKDREGFFIKLKLKKAKGRGFDSQTPILILSYNELIISEMELPKTRIKNGEKIQISGVLFCGIIKNTRD